ncbi:heterokaryon incompatibility protein-domain-containing protein [Triangularia setosa]|uniref:Heterokaryon incompatibility protein-domain-containing protein n=1 Tax=Triangularia setosa TaxID=2587417 RepID=A0AAN6WA29_9PEZI|nr:heterokaryon incompatibility protein-domain-containing protein [Podospora setosa]
MLPANDGEYPFDMTRTPPAWVVAAAANKLLHEQPEGTILHWPDVMKEILPIDELKSMRLDIPFEKLTRWKEFAPRFIWGDYITMSYTWGPPEPSHTIFLNDHEVQVGGNLYQMLQRLRKSVEVKQPHIKVWIDALCINQSDEKEKKTEVQKMDLIYSMALAV